MVMRMFSTMIGAAASRITVCTLMLAGGIAMPRTGVSQTLLLKEGDRIAIVGDSITEQKLYSKFMELYLLACVPELDLTMFQFGWSGERALGFAGRMENDLVPWRPTVVTTCYGMNDGSYGRYSDAIGKNYEEGIRRIQGRCKALGARMVVGGPGAVDTETWRRNEPEADQYYNENLAKLGEIAAQVAAEHGFVHAGLHPLMMKVMQDAKASLGVDYHVCGADGVHPAANGHLVMAHAFLKAMGLQGDIGTITLDMATGKAIATAGHRVLSDGDGKVQVESSRYPFCFSGDETDPNGTRSILPFLPFNRDLNRFLLVVRNLSAPAAEVSWGGTSKSFARADLEAGINLAAEFLDNPFSEAFRRLEQAVDDKQRRETRFIKGMITNSRGIRADFPEDQDFADTLDDLLRRLWDRNAQDAVRVRAAVQPVTHTFQITPQ